MEEEKESCRENGERWGDIKDEWITNWEAENWGDEQVAEAEKEFLDGGNLSTARRSRRVSMERDKGREPLTDDPPILDAK